MNRFKTLAIAALAAATVTVGVASQAEAGPFHRRHLGWGVGALATGLIVGGAIAASRSNAYASECYLTRRWVDGPYGPERRTIRVCE
ncbi:hypothetical protein [Phreatobacter sp.]|uniref:hypothetical protein n=1 Tax=Phreatobacter sp. TaxID=1966341 RepID=UPI0025E898A8|nr:hypothetical protein [Phreatobacter sp.]